MSLFKSIFGWIKNYGKAILFTFVFFLACLFAFFPYSDLSDLVGGKIFEYSGGLASVRFNKLGLKLWPGPGIQMSGISIDSPLVGSTEIDQLSVVPAVTAYFTKTPYGSVSLQGFLHGQIEATARSGTRSENGNDRHRIEIHASQLSLSDLHDFANLPVLLKGRLQLDLLGQVDASFADQPDLDLTIQADQFELPSQTINTMMGPVSVPSVRLGSIVLHGKWIAGQINIDRGDIGKESDDLHGKVTGTLGLSIQKGFQPQIGAYNLDIDLTLKPSLEEKLNLFLAAASQFKTSASDGSHYRIRVTAQNPMFPPLMSELR